MSKELADAIVLAAQKMERKEVEVISIISFNKDLITFFIDGGPKKRKFGSFASAYNHLATLGYQEVSRDKDNYFKKSFEAADGTYPVVMVMSKKVNKEQISTYMRISGFR